MQRAQIAFDASSRLNAAPRSIFMQPKVRMLHGRGSWLGAIAEQQRSSALLCEVSALNARLTPAADGDIARPSAVAAVPAAFVRAPRRTTGAGNTATVAATDCVQRRQHSCVRRGATRVVAARRLPLLRTNTVPAAAVCAPRTTQVFAALSRTLRPAPRNAARDYRVPMRAAGECNHTVGAAAARRGLAEWARSGAYASVRVACARMARQ